MLVSLTVGKVDAGVAVLLTEDKRLIEFPSILLPPDIHSGSIVDINVARNQNAELIAEQKFNALQTEIYNTFGSASPKAPVLRCRNATQTSVVLEWDPIELATAELRSLSLYRNGAKAGNIPIGKLSTKISGLGLDTAYTFHLVLRTSAGQYSSEKVTVKTHKMTDLHGITITPGIMPSQLKDSLAETVNKIGAKMIDQVRIDTTHFVCTEPRGQAWEKAMEMNVPVVVPDWIKGCEREGKIIGVRAYYLDADPSKRQIGPSVQQQQQQAQQQQQRPSVSLPHRDSPRIEHTPPTPEQPRPERSLSQQERESAATGSPTITPSESEGQSAAGGSLEGTTVAEKDGEAGENEKDGQDENEEEVKAKAGEAGEGARDDSEDEDEEHEGPEQVSVQEAADAAEAEGDDDDDKEDEEKDGKFDEISL